MAVVRPDIVLIRTDNRCVEQTAYDASIVEVDRENRAVRALVGYESTATDQSLLIDNIEDTEF